jgi:hypothetical protein
VQCLCSKHEAAAWLIIIFMRAQPPFPIPLPLPTLCAIVGRERVHHPQRLHSSSLVAFCFPLPLFSPPQSLPTPLLFPCINEAYNGTVAFAIIKNTVKYYCVSPFKFLFRAIYPTCLFTQPNILRDLKYTPVRLPTYNLPAPTPSSERRATARLERELSFSTTFLAIAPNKP